MAITATRHPHMTPLGRINHALRADAKRAGKAVHHVTQTVGNAVNHAEPLHPSRSPHPGHAGDKGK